MRQWVTRSEWSFFDMLAALITIVAIFQLLTYLTFDVRSRIDIINQTVVQEERVLYVEVDRFLRHSFDGGYSGIIRDSTFGNVVCFTDYQSIPYQKYSSTGELTKLPENMTLSYWAYGGSCTKKLTSLLPKGTYVMEVCHTVERPHWWTLWWKEECWKPVQFDVV